MSQGLHYVPYDIPLDTRLLGLQGNEIKEIRENDFKGLSNLYVRTGFFLAKRHFSKELGFYCHSLPIAQHNNVLTCDSCI